jgi:DNA polymerase-3 subunit delta
MQLKLEQLDASLKRGLKPLYVLHGDEPLLAQEAADALRAAARAAGFSERRVFTVSGAHFDWSGVLGAAQSMSLFGDRQLIEIRIPSGKPGKDGSEFLQRYVEEVVGPSGDAVLTLVTLPRLDGQQARSAWFTALDAAGVSLRLDPVERHALPGWLAQRLARQGQRVKAGEEGERTLAFFADRVEGNLLAAHQEIGKLALLHGEGELSFDDVQAAVLNVARFDTAKLAAAVWSADTPRALRVLDGLRDEGEAVVMVHWNLASDIRALARSRAALDAGQPLPLALREAGAWGKERLFERVLPTLSPRRAAQWLNAASICDGICKGLRHPQWPEDAWLALRALVMMVSAPSPAATATAAR